MVVPGVVLTSDADDALGLLNDVRLVDHAASALRGSGVVDLVLVGRGASGHAGLHDVLSRLAGAEIVVLHDAYRPLAPAELVIRVVEAVRAGADVAVPVVEVTECGPDLAPALSSPRERPTSAPPSPSVTRAGRIVTGRTGRTAAPATGRGSWKSGSR